MKKNVTFPDFLIPGDRIAVLSPAGAAPQEDILEGIEMIAGRGYEVVLMPNTFTQYESGYTYAGTEKQRLDDLNAALADPEVKAIWTTRGGYGSMHLLKHILFPKKKQMPWLIGYSDVTAIQAHFLREKGIASIHGQSLRKASFGVNPNAYEAIFNALEGEFPNFEFETTPFNREGSAVGQLVGGNLALIYALLGTEYSFKFKGRILFIEEIGEKLYSLDRMLMALELAGVFDKISGLVVGGLYQMGNAEDADYQLEFSQKAAEIIQKRVKDYEFPVAFSFPNGHIYDNFPLIIGAEVRLEVDKKLSSLLYG